MKQSTRQIHPLLERMGRIQRMERGKICRMSGRSQYNHQTWQEGRNVVRYVSTDRLASLQEAIDGYRLFMELAQAYADQIIQRTRREPPPPPLTTKRSGSKIPSRKKGTRVNPTKDV